MGRKDGTRVKVDGLHKAMFNLYPNRTEAEVFLKDEIDAGPLLKFVEKKNEEDPSLKTKPWHVILQAVAKTIYMRPLLNRFICGRKIYQRNDIVLSFVVKQELADGSEEKLLVEPIPEDGTLDDMSRLVLGTTGEIRSGEADSGLDGIMNFYSKMPRFLERFIVAIIKWMSFHGFLPRSFTNDDPHHSTVLLSNLGSIKCPAPYHHLNNFGTNSIIATVGEIHKGPACDAEGNIVAKDLVDIGITLDERISDGFYFARSFKLLKHLLEHPELLDGPVNGEIDYEKA